MTDGRDMTEEEREMEREALEMLGKSWARAGKKVLSYVGFMREAADGMTGPAVDERAAHLVARAFLRNLQERLVMTEEDSAFLFAQILMPMARMGAELAGIADDKKRQKELG